MLCTNVVSSMQHQQKLVNNFLRVFLFILSIIRCFIVLIFFFFGMVKDLYLMLSDNTKQKGGRHFFLQLRPTSILRFTAAPVNICWLIVSYDVRCSLPQKSFVSPLLLFPPLSCYVLWVPSFALTFPPLLLKLLRPHPISFLHSPRTLCLWATHTHACVMRTHSCCTIPYKFKCSGPCVAL